MSSRFLNKNNSKNAEKHYFCAAPKRKIFVCALSIVLLVNFIGCGSSKPELPPPPPEVPNSQRPSALPLARDAARQTLNITADNAYGIVLNGLAKRGVRVGYANPSSGEIETRWTSVTDRLCNTNPPSKAALSCRMKHSFKVSAISSISSAVAIKNEELCVVTDEVPLNCPGSAAERLTASIIEELNANDESQEYKRKPESVRY